MQSSCTREKKESRSHGVDNKRVPYLATELVLVRTRPAATNGTDQVDHGCRADIVARVGGRAAVRICLSPAAAHVGVSTTRPGGKQWPVWLCAVHSGGCTSL
jgi:hypothetical protein